MSHCLQCITQHSAQLYKDSLSRIQIHRPNCKGYDPYQLNCPLVNIIGTVSASRRKERLRLQTNNIQKYAWKTLNEIEMQTLHIYVFCSFIYFKLYDFFFLSVSFHYGFKYIVMSVSYARHYYITYVCNMMHCFMFVKIMYKYF